MDKFLETLKREGLIKAILGLFGGGSTPVPPPARPSAPPSPPPYVPPSLPQQPSPYYGDFQPAPIPKSVPVRIRRSFFSRAEEAFYHELLKVLELRPEHLYCKPRLDDIFEPNGNMTQGEKNRLRNKHVDFLITDQHYRPLFGIELDGDSHNTPQQEHNDRVKDMVFRSAKMPLIRFKNSENATAADIAKRLKERGVLQ